MTDVFDQAQILDGDFREFALQQHRRDHGPTYYTGTDCIDCEEEIPAARREAMPGCMRCIECQNDFENRRPL